MNERKSLTNTIPMEVLPSIMSSDRKNRVVMSQIFAALMKQVPDQPAEFGQALVKIVKHPPLPDGTGQIINIGV